MNIEKITFRIIKDHITKTIDGTKSDFIVKMMIAQLTDEQRGAIMDEIVNDGPYVKIKKGDRVMFNPRNNQYDVKDLFEEDMMKDALLMTNEGYLYGNIIDDTNYKDECSPYATEYKIDLHYTVETGEHKRKEIRVKRCNILKCTRKGDMHHKQTNI